MRRRTTRLLGAALALSLLAACSADKATSGSSASGSTGAAKSSSTPGATSDPATNGANQIGIDQPDLSKVLFSKHFAIPGKPQRKVSVGILSLERKDQVAILKVVVTPEFADKPASETIGFEEALGQNGFHWTPTMLDLKNLKKYKVLWNGGSWLNGETGEALSGQPIYGWAAFAPPPTGVPSVDLTITEWMPQFTNVPIR